MLRHRAAVSSMAAAWLTASTLAACGATAAAPAPRPRALLRAQPGVCGRATADPGAPGPYRVGTAHIALGRRSSPTGRPRRIDPTIWYPTSTRAGAPVTCRSGLVLFSHGANGAPSDYGQLLAHLASEGFVVVAAHHPDRGADHLLERIERLRDVTFLLDRIAPLVRRLAPGLVGRIDLGRVGIAGHSFGGFTAAQLAASDPRIDAALVMAGGNSPKTGSRIRVPVLAMAGGADRLVPVAQVRRFYAGLPASTPHGLLVLGGAGHGAYGDGCGTPRTCGIVATYATSFFLTYLDGLRGPAVEGPLDPRRPRAARLTLRTVAMPPR